MIRFTLLAALAVACFPGCEASSPATAPPPPTVSETVRRLANMLDYVAADYPGAVVDGKLSEAGRQGEYAEQLAFVRDAQSLAAELPASAAARGGEVGARLAELQRAVEEKAAAQEVARRARGLRADLLAAYGVVLAPAGPPSRDRGGELYALCVNCHGERGGGDGPLAAKMDPPPRSFLDAEVMAELSPTRAFNALTDGIAGTDMPSYGTLSPSDRWSLAFYLFTLRHEPGAAERGRRAFAEVGGGLVAATPTRLANLSDGELAARGERAGLDSRARAEVLAYLRREAPYQTTGAPLDRARELLAAGVAAARANDRGEARRLAAAAYLDGFEPHEAALRRRDARLVHRLEDGFLRLREAIAAGALLDEIEQRALRIGTGLDSGDELLAQRGGTQLAFASSFFIVLREGIEGALLILLLLGIARRAGAGTGDVRAVHGGWLAAVGAGAVTWFASSAMLRAIGGAERELLEGIVALLAAAVLLGVSHFVLARLDAQRRVAALKQRLERAASTPRRRWVLASLAFVAVYREAFETVLFLQAVLLDPSASPAAMTAGVLAAAAVLIALVAAMHKLGRRLRPAPLLTALGFLLSLLSLALTGKGVRALQEAGVIGITPIEAPHFDWLGLFPTRETLAAQLVVLAAFIALSAWALLRSRRQTVQQPTKHPGTELARQSNT